MNDIGLFSVRIVINISANVIVNTIVNAISVINLNGVINVFYFYFW